MILTSVSETGLSLEEVEWGLTAAAVGLAVAWPKLGFAWFSRVERIFAQLARRQRLAVFVVGLAALLLRLALLPLSPIPQPFTPDDFSFLLAGYTFASGRLANPTPAMWTHFESIHITMQPTYASMYFPAQGLILGAGKALFGHPWFGLLCVTSLMCAAICWMLQAWLPPSWALLGGCIAILRLGIFSYWINTYTGAGSIAALGGALVLGAFPRILRTARLSDCMLLTLGIVIAAMSRAYEGFLLCLPVAFLLGRWILTGKNRPAASVLIRRAALPLAMVVAGGLWMGYYDYKAFGSPTTLPYQVDRATYAISPYWIWQRPGPEPAYRHTVFRDFYVKGEFSVIKKYRTPIGFVLQNLAKPVMAINFYGGIALLPALIMLPRALRDRRIRFFAIAGGVVWAPGLFIIIFFLPHYLAPFTAALYAVGLQCMRHLRVWRPRQLPIGLGMVRFVVALCVVLAAIRASAQPLHLGLCDWPPGAWTANWIGTGQLGARRTGVEERLERFPGKQLAIVRYAPEHDPVWEWVYNAPDIDGSKVIWAREMDSSNNAELIAHYKDRHVWLVEPDAMPAKLSPYPMPVQVAGAH